MPVWVAEFTEVVHGVSLDMQQSPNPTVRCCWSCGDLRQLVPSYPKNLRTKEIMLCPDQGGIVDHRPPHAAAVTAGQHLAPLSAAQNVVPEAQTGWRGY